MTARPKRNNFTIVVVYDILFVECRVVVRVPETRRERPKSAPYLRLKNIQGTTIGNIWKNYFFQKILKFFFRKKSIFLESRTMPKNSKRGHSGSLNVFTNRKLQKKCN